MSARTHIHTNLNATDTSTHTRTLGDTDAKKGNTNAWPEQHGDEETMLGTRKNKQSTELQ